MNRDAEMEKARRDILFFWKTYFPEHFDKVAYFSYESKHGQLLNEFMNAVLDGRVTAHTIAAAMNRRQKARGPRPTVIIIDDLEDES